MELDQPSKQLRGQHSGHLGLTIGFVGYGFQMMRSEPVHNQISGYSVNVAMSRAQKTRCLLLAAVVAMGIFLLWYAVSRPADQRDRVVTASDFVHYLVKNDIRGAKALAVPTQWPRIEAWMTQRDAFKCPFSLDIDSEVAWGGGLVPGDAITATYHYTYQCAEKAYRLSVDHIVLQRIEDEWVVLDWTEVCESWDWGDTHTCE